MIPVLTWTGMFLAYLPLLTVLPDVLENLSSEVRGRLVIAVFQPGFLSYCGFVITSFGFLLTSRMSSMYTDS